MEKGRHKKFEDEQPFEGAIQQITPAPDNFVPQGMLNFDKPEEIVIKRKPHRNRLLASMIYTLLQSVVFGGIMLNYSLFGGLADFVLWALTIMTFIAYFRVAFSNPGYVEGNIIMTEEMPEEKLHAFDTQPSKEPKTRGNFCHFYR